MEVKKYKVVCSQPQFSDDIYIDIAPDAGIIHDQILFSRMMLHRQTDSQPLARLFGSIYLEDDNGNIKVNFPAPQSPKDSPLYQAVTKQYIYMEPQIIETYRKMKQAGEESTLFVYGINEMFETSAARNAEADAFERRCARKRQEVEQKTAATPSYKEKHAAQLGPQTPQEEARIKQKEQFSSIRERRIAGERKRAQEPLSAWQRFQKVYSGD